MKTIIVNDYAYINGGASQIAIKTAKMLAQKKIETCLFTGVGPISEELLNVSHLRVVCLNQSDILSDKNRCRAVINGLWNIKAKHRFEELLNQYNNKDTIIHIHTLSKCISSSIVRVAYQRGYKIVYHLHDYGIACPNLGFFNYNKNNICRYKSMGKQCIVTNCDSRKFVHKVWRVMRQFLQINFGGLPKNANGFIAVSKFSIDLLREYIPKDKEIVILPNPVADDNCQYVDVNVNKKFIFIGRLSEEKNPVLLAKCAKELDVPVLFIGSGPCEEAIKSVNANAVITGWLSKDDINEYMKDARCLVLTSNCYETQGLVVLEAARNGIPSIVPNTSAAIEFVQNDYNGLIFEVNNAESLKKNMLKVIDNDFWKKISINVKKDCINIENDIDYIEKILSFYKKILS